MASFLDTNILLRYFLHDDEEKARHALALIQRVEQGDEIVESNALVVFEMVYVLQRVHRIPKQQVRDMLQSVLNLRGLRISDRDLCSDALDLFAEKNISFADAYSGLYMKARGLTAIYSWDTDFDRIEGIERVEP